MARGVVRPKAAHNVVAIYPEMERAREAMAHLERAGIEAGDISVVPEEAEDVEDTSLRDAKVVGLYGIWMAVTAGAIAGSLFGGFLGGMAGLSMSDDWELTFESLQKGGAAVVIASDDGEEVEKAAKTLLETSPLRLERFNAQGGRLVTQ